MMTFLRTKERSLQRRVPIGDCGRHQVEKRVAGTGHGVCEVVVKVGTDALSRIAGGGR